MNELAHTTVVTAAQGKTIFGQPRGLATLFLTEMWERFTYYGMRAVLILYMVAAAREGGLGIDDRTANNAYGLYVGSTYLFGLLGGWIADRLIGSQRAVIGGALFIIVGNLLLTLGNTPIFFLGLLVIAVGIGLLKTNCSAMVAGLYPEGGSRRDAGFSAFYMGINLGAFIGPLLVPVFATWLGYRWCFVLPAFGMALGLAQFMWTRHYLGHAGAAAVGQRGSWTPIIVIAALLGAVVIAVLSGALRINAVSLAASVSWAMGVLAIAYFVYLLFFARLNGTERNRVLVMVALFAASVLFWAGYEQTGASFNLFAQRYTDRNVFGWNMPAGVLQAVDPLFVIIFAPVFAAVWIALGKRDRDLTASAKFGVGMIFLGAGFLVMYLAAQRVLSGALVLPTWLVLTYLLHTFAELCLSPVGLSYFSKLAPPRFVGQAMGMWFLSLALGSNLAGQLSGQVDPSHLESLPALFLKIFWYGVIGGAVMLLLAPYVKRMMAGVR
jgi:POT family proton-dependent oligopeptide transporter